MRPGTGLVSGAAEGCSAIASLLPVHAPERCPRGPDHQIPVVEDLRDDVRALLDLEVHEVGLAVLVLVDRGEFARARLNKRPMIVVKHRPQKEWSLIGE